MEWTYREEAGRNSIESISALEGFLAKNNTSSLFDFSASPFHGIRWDLGIGLRFSGRIHGVSVTLHRENPFRFDDSSALPTKQVERRAGVGRKEEWGKKEESEGGRGRESEPCDLSVRKLWSKEPIGTRDASIDTRKMTASLYSKLFLWNPLALKIFAPSSSKRRQTVRIQRSFRFKIRTTKFFTLVTSDQLEITHLIFVRWRSIRKNK